MSAKTICGTRKALMLGAFLLFPAFAASIHSIEGDIRLSPPGLRPVAEPDLAVPANFQYANRPIALPAYRDAAGNPRGGWRAKFVATRRFASNQSAWIFYRIADLRHSVVAENQGGRSAFRFWPVGATLVIEIYSGDASQKDEEKLIEIAAMSKSGPKEASLRRAFYPVNWSYSRFDPRGTPSITDAQVRRCHQCHSIAFHYSGDLIFTRFP